MEILNMHICTDLRKILQSCLLVIDKFKQVIVIDIFKQKNSSDKNSLVLKIFFDLYWKNIELFTTVVTNNVCIQRNKERGAVHCT